MIDNFALGLSHGLMILAAWYLLRMPALDREPRARDAVFENSRKSEFHGGAGPLPRPATHQDTVWAIGRGSGPTLQNAPSAHFPTDSKDQPPLA